MFYTVISTDTSEFDWRATKDGQAVSAQIMRWPGLLQWYMDNWGYAQGTQAEQVTFDQIEDELVGEYEFLRGVSSERFDDTPEQPLNITITTMTDLQDLTPDEAAEELYELLQNSSPNIRGVQPHNNNIVPPSDWLEQVAALYEATAPDNGLPFDTQLKDYLDTAAMCIATEAGGNTLPVAMRIRLQIDTMLLKSAVVEHFDSGEAIDLLHTIKANFRGLTDDIAPQTYDHQPKGAKEDAAKEDSIEDAPPAADLSMEDLAKIIEEKYRNYDLTNEQVIRLAEVAHTLRYVLGGYGLSEKNNSPNM